MPECKSSRRDFLKAIPAAEVTGAVLALNPADALSDQKTKPKPVNKGPVYDLAKKVLDLSQEAWHPERYQHHGFYSGVIGILNLNQGLENCGHYLKIRSNRMEGVPLGYNQPGLELTAVNGVDPKIAEGIDYFLANLELKDYTPPMDDVTQNEFKRIQKDSNEAGFEITQTAAAVLAIWNKKILGCAEKQKLPVLRLYSGLGSGLGNLHSVGIGKNGHEPTPMESPYFTEFSSEMQGMIIQSRYVPVLTKALLPLEREIKRIYNLRLKEEGIGKEERAKTREAAEIATLRLREEELVRLAQMILDYPI